MSYFVAAKPTSHWNCIGQKIKKNNAEKPTNIRQTNKHKVCYTLWTHQEWFVQGWIQLEILKRGGDSIYKMAGKIRGTFKSAFPVKNKSKNITVTIRIWKCLGSQLFTAAWVEWQVYYVVTKTSHSHNCQFY